MKNLFIWKIVVLSRNSDSRSGWQSLSKTKIKFYITRYQSDFLLWSVVQSLVIYSLSKKSGFLLVCFVFIHLSTSLCVILWIFFYFSLQLFYHIKHKSNPSICTRLIEKKECNSFNKLNMKYIFKNTQSTLSLSDDKLLLK